ncbi:MAG TPA: tRNA 2-thiouridine(34) synthase MnmA [Clostridia bacterium]|nr:tRNA 2-thiouridine(34) synthase MnmA [Clostridia bacterium]
MNKVMVAMSGGVDSSVSALLLKQQGFDLCGATLSLYSNNDIGLCDTKTCCSLDDVEDARRVCARLGIDHFVFNLKEQFKQGVIEPFAEGYRRGETPNPCVECNRSIKFSGVLARARQLDYDAIATGHYVQSKYDVAVGRWLLKKGRDPAKDQSYVLYMLTQPMLARTLFPLGGLTKREVREMAEEHGLVTARKSESQDICFVPDGDYAGFLAKTLGVVSEPGCFVSPQGEVLGRHEGMIHYTLGQRRGLGISADRRLFVVKKNMESNTVVLGDEVLLMRRRMTIDRLNWVSVAAPQSSIRAEVKSRYRQSAQPAWLHPQEDGSILVEFDAPQRALTPGQAAVFYAQDVVLGGGTIRDCTLEGERP